MSEQLARTFTPDGQFRMVVEMREKFLSGQLKLKSQPPSQDENHSISSRGVMV